MSGEVGVVFPGRKATLTVKEAMLTDDLDLADGDGLTGCYWR